MSEHSLSATLERLCNLLRTDVRQRALRHGLRPVHVEALLYLARCNRYSDTPQAVTEFLGSTKGTVSQTLKVLERKELLVKRPDADDGRVVRLRLTSTGRDLAEELAAGPLSPDALVTDSGRGERLSEDLRDLLGEMQRTAGHRSFGACRTCRYFRRDEAGYRCGLTHETLTAADSLLLCREHEHPETVVLPPASR